VQDTTEALVREVFREVVGAELADPFPRMPYEEAMRRFGSDKPDLRIPLELVDVAAEVAGCGFKVFDEWAANPAGRIAVLRCPGAAGWSRKQIDELGAHAAKYGAKGLAWMKVEARDKGREGVNSPIAKFLGDEVLAAVLDAAGAAD